MKLYITLFLFFLYPQNLFSTTFTSETYIEINSGNAPAKIVLSEEAISQTLNSIYGSTYPLSIGTMLTLIAFPILCDKTTLYIEKKHNIKNLNFCTMLTVGITYTILGYYLFTNKKNLTSLLIKNSLK